MADCHHRAHPRTAWPRCALRARSVAKASLDGAQVPISQRAADFLRARYTCSGPHQPERCLSLPVVFDLRS